MEADPERGPDRADDEEKEEEDRGPDEDQRADDAFLALVAEKQTPHRAAAPPSTPASVPPMKTAAAAGPRRPFVSRAPTRAVPPCAGCPPSAPARRRGPPGCPSRPRRPAARSARDLDQLVGFAVLLEDVGAVDHEPPVRLEGEAVGIALPGRVRLEQARDEVANIDVASRIAREEVVEGQDQVCLHELPHLRVDQGDEVVIVDPARRVEHHLLREPRVGQDHRLDGGPVGRRSTGLGCLPNLP